MQHCLEDLEILWKQIKDKHNIFWGEYTGLMSVDFSHSIDDFIKNYSQQVTKFQGRECEIKVFGDIKDALKFLQHVEINCHHLSCAADFGFGDNSALCIHYKNPRTNNNGTMAIPGINYVPTQETLDSIKKIDHQE